MGNKQVKPIEIGRWVENKRSIGFNQYQVEHFKGNGTYHWEGPEPSNGQRPPNPAETPEGIARLEQMKEENANRKIREAERRKEETRAQQNALDEDRACKTACAKAVEELRATRKSTQSAGRRKMKKYKQKWRKTYRFR